MKTITHAAITALFIIGATATAHADTPSNVDNITVCNRIGNWIGGHNHNCPVSDAGGDKFKRKMKEEAPDEEETAAK